MCYNSLLYATNLIKPLNMLQKNLDNSYLIKYSNYFEIENKMPFLIKKNKPK